jgi:hypothetical protein
LLIEQNLSSAAIISLYKALEHTCLPKGFDNEFNPMPFLNP